MIKSIHIQMHTHIGFHRVLIIISLAQRYFASPPKQLKVSQPCLVHVYKWLASMEIYIINEPMLIK